MYGTVTTTALTVASFRRPAVELPPQYSASERLPGSRRGVKGTGNVGHCGGVMVAYLSYARDSSEDCYSHPTPTRPPAGWSSG